MVTPHQNAISYLSLGELWNVINDSANSSLFEKYFSPKDNTDARIKEIKNIRNFEPNSQTLEWYKRRGLLYEISICSLRSAIQNDSTEDFRDSIVYELDFEEMLRATEGVHDKCVHISIESNGKFSAVFPAHLGVENNFTTVATILRAGVNCRDRSKIRDHEIEKLSRRTPEYILWPDNPIFGYDDLMTENLINLDQRITRKMGRTTQNPSTALIFSQNHIRGNTHE